MKGAFSMKQILGIIFLSIVSAAIVETTGLININSPVLLVFGLFYNLFINGLIYLLGAFKTFQLPDGYYAIKRFEKQGKLYTIFGVDYARRLLKLSGAVRRTRMVSMQNIHICSIDFYPFTRHRSA